MPVPIAAVQSTAEIAAGPLVWGGLLAFLAAMVLVDLRVGAADQAMTVRRAATWSGVWFGLALAFGAGLWVLAGSEAGESYLAGYVMEKALSLDNVFVFTLIFAALAVPPRAAAAAALRHPRRARPARRVHLRGRRGARALQLGRVAVRRAAGLHGLEDPAARDDKDEGAEIVERIRRRFPAAKPAVLALLAIAFADVLFAVDSVPADPRHHHRHVRRLRRQRVRPHGPARPLLPDRRPRRRASPISRPGSACC